MLWHIIPGTLTYSQSLLFVIGFSFIILRNMDERYHAIAVTGKAGTGSSSVSQELQRALTLVTGKTWDLHESGPVFRNVAASQGINLARTQDFPNSLHEGVDTAMTMWMQDEDGRHIVEGWLAGFLSWAKGIPGVFSLLLVCGDDVRFDRILQREREKGREGLTLDLIRAETLEREANNLDVFRRNHGDHAFWDPEIYDLAIDTTELQVRNTVALTLAALALASPVYE